MSLAMAGLVVCKVQMPVDRPLSARLELPSPSLGGAGPSTAPRWAYIGLPNGHFLSWPGVTCSPNCLQTPRHLPTPLPLLMPGQLLGALFTLSKLTLEESAHYQEHKSFNAGGFFFLSFQDPFSCSPAPRPGKAEVPSPRQVLCSLRCPKPLEVCIVLYLRTYLWTALPTPRGSSQPATSVLAPAQGLAPPPALNPPVARVPGSRVYALQFKQVRKNSSLLPCRWRAQTPNQQDHPAPPPPGSLKTYLLP